jgi:hypothetical protein
MEDVGSDDAARGRTILDMPIRKANTAMVEEDADLVYDHTSRGTRSNVDTFATIMSIGLLLRGEPP